MKEYAIVSGKGGTGKTSLVASFAVLANRAVVADCDVDAADLHLVLAPTVRRRETFLCGREAVIRQADCVSCGACLTRCRFGAVRKGEGGAGEARFDIDPNACEGCGVCVTQCPVQAIDFPERASGTWFVSDTRRGPMVHAELAPGAENSGKLVAKVREEARSVGEEHGCALALVDGPPGIGCAVIAAISGASLAIVIAEPTLSGAHDMARVLALTRHFNIPSAVCVNKWDLNPDMATMIEDEAARGGAVSVGRVRYDRSVTAAQMQGKAVTELSDALSGPDIRAVWKRIEAMETS